MIRAVAVLILLAAGPAAARDEATVKDWWAACDNLRVCTAFGFPAEDGTGVALRIRRDAERAAAPRIDVIVDAEAGKGVDGRLDLAVDGLTVARTADPTGEADDFRDRAVIDSDVGSLLAAARSGTRLDLKTGDRVIGSVSLSGFSAALRFIDDRQKRAGTVTALVASGPALADAVPTPPPLPVVRPARTTGQAGLGSIPPASVEALVKPLDCADPAMTPEVPGAQRLSPGVVMWTLPCWVGPYNLTSVLVLTDERGGHARLADLTGVGPPEDRAMATNVEFDPDSQTLSAYSRGVGPGDCGIGETYVWTGRAFALSSRSEMSACRGLSYDYWPDTYRTREAR